MAFIRKRPLIRYTILTLIFTACIQDWPVIESDYYWCGYGNVLRIFIWICIEFQLPNFQNCHHVIHGATIEFFRTLVENS